jgi:DNA repair exonuclease SbcCD ATPase subunit
MIKLKYMLFFSLIVIGNNGFSQDKTAYSFDVNTPWFVVTIICFLLALIAFFWNLQTKKVLSLTEASIEEMQDQIQEEKEQMETEVKERTVGIVKLNEQLNAQINDLHEELDEKLKLISELKELLEVKAMGDFLPICSNCKDVRDENGFWRPIEEFIRDLSDSDLSHTLCPECTKKLYPELFDGGAKPFCLSWNPGKGRH